MQDLCQPTELQGGSCLLVEAWQCSHSTSQRCRASSAAPPAALIHLHQLPQRQQQADVRNTHRCMVWIPGTLLQHSPRRTPDQLSQLCRTGPAPAGKRRSAPAWPHRSPWPEHPAQRDTAVISQNQDVQAVRPLLAGHGKVDRRKGGQNSTLQCAALCACGLQIEGENRGHIFR